MFLNVSFNVLQYDVCASISIMDSRTLRKMDIGFHPRTILEAYTPIVGGKDLVDPCMLNCLSRESFHTLATAPSVQESINIVSVVVLALRIFIIYMYIYR